MNNTNDEQAPYGEKREPLLSDEAQYDLCGEAGEPVDQPEYCGGPGLYSARRVRDFYENLIDKGELRVVKKVTDVGDHWSDPTCSDCGTKTVVWAKFCPVCGGEIQK